MNVIYGIVTHAGVALTAGLVYRFLGDEFGVFALVLTSAASFHLLDDSLGAFVVTTMSRKRRTDADTESAATINGLLGAITRTYAIGSVLFGLGLGVGLSLLLSQREDAYVLGFWGMCCLCGFSGVTFFAKLLEGREEYLRLRICQAVLALMRVSGVVILLTSQLRDVSELLAWYVCCSFLLATSLAVLLHRRAPGVLRQLVSSPAPGSYRKIFSFCRPLLLAKGAAVASYRLDLWIVQGLAGAGATATYAMAEAVARVAGQTLEVVKTVVLPVSVKSWRNDDRSWIHMFVVGTSKASVLVAGGACICLWAALDPVLLVWFGNIPEGARTTAQLLLLFTVLTAFRSSGQSILAGQHLFQHLERHFLVASVLNVAVSLAATWAWGVWGAAFGTAVAGIYLLLRNITAVERALQIDLGTLARSTVLPGFLCLLLAWGAATVATAPTTPTLQAITRGGVAAMVFVTFFWLVLLDASERRWLVREFRRKGDRS